MRWVCVLVAVAAAVGSPRAAWSYELKQTGHGAFERWDASRVAFVIDPSVEQAAPGATKAIASALASWSGQGGAPVLSATRGAGGGKVANDGHNTILYAPDGYAPAGRALAVTVSTVEDASGTVVDTDIVINGPWAFSVLPADAHGSGEGAVSTEGTDAAESTDAAFDLEHVVSHEIGHALGLADVDNDGHAVMYAFTAPEDASNRAPSADDLRGLDSLYGGPLKTAGCGRASIAAASPHGWALTAATALLVMLVRPLRRRKRRERA